MSINFVPHFNNEVSCVFASDDNFAPYLGTAIKSLIENSTKEGEIVLDPFVGIGATPLACMQSGRKFIGTELDTEEGYWDILVNRLEHNGDYIL